MLEKTLGVSYGTAVMMGMKTGNQLVNPTCAYLLWDRGCKGACSFCHRANGNLSSKKLSRITWPEYKINDIIDKLNSQKNLFERLCIQTSYNPDMYNELREIIKTFLKLDLRLSMTLSPSQADFALEMIETGVEHIGIGLDAASEDTYLRHKKKCWKSDFKALNQLIDKAGSKIEVHMIFGLGDSEETFIKCMEKLTKSGGQISLFALVPVNGGTRPSIDSYRKVQAIRYLLQKQAITANDCFFENGILKGLQYQKADFINMLDNGTAFQTSGCKKCNRPFYNEVPGKEFYNYPRPLTNEEFQQALSDVCNGIRFYQ